MGKSGTTSCFKFVGCGDPNSVDRDDLPAAEVEIKDSNDKRKWSFRKRSATHRVLSNSVISETSLGSKSSLDTAVVGFQKQATCTNINSKLAEKIPPAKEKSAADVVLDEFSGVDKTAADVSPDEKYAADVTSDENTAADVTPDEKNAAHVTPDEFSGVDKTAADVTPDEKNAADVTPDEKNAADVTPYEFSGEDKTAADVTPHENTAADVTSDENTAADVILDENTVADVTPVEKNAADVVPPDEFSAVEKSESEVNPDESSALEKGAPIVTPDEKNAADVTPDEKNAADVTSYEFSGVDKTAADVTPHENYAADVTSDENTAADVTPDEKNAADVIPDEKNAAADVTPDEKNAADVPPDEFSAVEKSESEVNPDESSALEKGAPTITPDESSVIIIQTAVRGFLAQKDLTKNNAMIMLQSAIRGFNVRRAAVGSLRCVQAIVKMQVLIRKRRACSLLEGSRFDEKDGKLDKQDSKGMEKRRSKLVAYTPIEELLCNSFARQLLESDPRSKAIHIKCEPLKSDSAWKWMERWMSIYSNGSSNNSAGLEYTTENPDEKSLDKSDYLLNSGISQTDNCQSRETKSSDEESVVPSEKNAIIHGMLNFESNNDTRRLCSVTTCSEDRYDDVSDSYPDQATESGFTSSHREPDSFKQQIESKFSSITEPDSLKNQSDMGKPHPLTTCLENHYDDVSDSLPDQATESNKEPVSFTNLSEREYKEHIESCCGASIMEPDSLTNQSDSSETTGRRVVLGSRRRSSNSAFIAAQSKFEELSLAANSAKPVGLSKQDASLQLPFNGVSLVPDIRKRNHMNSTVDTEVDSLIIEGISVQEDKHENIASDGSNDDGSGRAVEQTESDGSRGVKIHAETEISHITGPDSHETPSSQVSVKPKKSSSRENVQTESSHPLSPLSPQASPRSHVTGPDSQETPSSHVSVKSKKSSRKSTPDRKQKSRSSGNGYKSDSNHDSSARNDLEQLSSMDKKTGKRRNSFGSASTDHGNQEQRESSSNSIPSYMQATESARAKAIANNSPRSIPDTLGKDFHIKKRHSLPGVNTKHVSPQAQAEQSTSQTLQDAKANGVHSPQERKWRR